MLIPPGFTSICTAYERFRERDAKGARGQLTYLFVTGKLRAFYLDHELNQHTLPGTYWKDNDYIDYLFSTGELSYEDEESYKANCGKIETGNALDTEGDDVEILFVAVPENDRKYGEDIEVYSRKTHVIVREDELSAILDAQRNAVSVASTGGIAHKGGRPAKFDKDAIWTVIFKLERERKFVGKTQDQIIEDVQAQYDEWFGSDSAPSRTTLQAVIAKLLAVLGGADPTTAFSNKKQKPRKAKNKVRSS